MNFAQHPREVHHRREDRQRDDAGNDASNDEVAERVDRGRLRASICSVTRIAPSSAPIPAPMRPERSKAAVKGPVSVQVQWQTGGDEGLSAEPLEDARVCIERTTPTARPETAMSGAERKPSS